MNKNRKEPPFFSIINHNFSGDAPECLTELTEIELAMITPVKTYGFVFSYKGGKQKNLKGNMVYMRVKEHKRIVDGACELEALGLTNHVVVLGSGTMTSQQKKKVKEKATVRTDKIIAAVKWLCENNSYWKKFDYSKICDDLSELTPTFLDESRQVESEDSNLEDQEVFSCFFPDGSRTTDGGGFDDAGAFKDFVRKMQSSKYGLGVKSNIPQEFVYGDKEDEFVNSSLLQFPYGKGGMDEPRTLGDGSICRHIPHNKLDDYIKHLSMISKPTYQNPLFSLILYSQKSKNLILKNSRLQVRGESDAKNLANGLSSGDLDTAIFNRRTGRRNEGTYVSKRILDSVDAVSKALPHTNDAAKKALGTGEAMQHHFGIGSIFLTVTFDDDCNLLMQVMSGVEVDDNRDVDAMEDSELGSREEKRKEIRLKFPGMASMQYEMLLNIVMEEVVGWDMRRNKPTEKPGYFGECEAVALATEEQGRKTLHGHMTLWIKGYRQLVDKSVGVGKKKKHTAQRDSKRSAEQDLAVFFDSVSRSELMGGLDDGNKRFLQKAFDHECRVPQYSKRKLPCPVGDQDLRILRHIKGTEETNGKFATCPHCFKNWTYEELVADYTVQGLQIVGPESVCGEINDTVPNDKHPRTLPSSRLRAKVIACQKIPGKTPIPSHVNALYNCHVSSHCKGCFKCSKKRKHICTSKCECRYRMPDRPRKRARVRSTGSAVPWFEWTGIEKKQEIVQVIPARKPYDLFQNVSCPAISESKLCCNSNISCITDGPVSQYMFKYSLKGTQESESEEYEEVSKSMKKLNGRTHDKDWNEALRLVCRAAFAHNKTNVTSAPMGTFLARKGTRFYFSHDFVYCPLQDLSKLLRNQSVDSSLQFHGDKGFLENNALHYLCRAKELEDVSVSSFFEEYVVCRNVESEEELFPFIGDTGNFEHPSKSKDGQKVIQAVKPAKKNKLAKVTQWQFPDTAKFEGNILKCKLDDINSAMEEYARLVMILFYPHRCEADLRLGTHRPFTRKFRAIYNEDKKRLEKKEKAIVFSVKNCTFLQNLQNTRSNSLRYRLVDDDLQSRTEAFKPVSDDPEDGFDKEGEEDNEEEVDPHSYEELLQLMEDNDDICSPKEVQTTWSAFPDKMSFQSLRDKGKDRCGYDRSIQPKTATQSMEPFLKVSTNTRNQQANTSEVHVRWFSFYPVL